jgi:hypothetical protein
MPYIFDRYPHDYLVGGFNPSEKYEVVPNIWKNISHVPNHQPVLYIYICMCISHIHPHKMGPPR